MDISVKIPKLNPCEQIEIYKKKIKETHSVLYNFKLECDKLSLQSFIKFWPAAGTDEERKGQWKIIDLLRVLFNYVTQEQIEKKRRITFLEFVMLFPRDTTGKFNFRRQHVFEAICRIILVLNYDNNYWGKNKEFYNKLEGWNEEKPKLEIDDILNQKINDSSAAGSVDIFFKISKDKREIYNKERLGCDKVKKEKVFRLPKKCLHPGCKKKSPFKDEEDLIRHKIEEHQIETKHKNDLFVMIQNKFFTKEFTSEDKYDVNKILNRASGLNEKIFQKADRKLVLMINDKSNLLKRVKWTNTGGVPEEDIFGIDELNDWFDAMIQNMINKGTFEKFYPGQGGMDHGKPLNVIKPRFHQKFFINSTLQHIKEGNKKFVWGAVPRSGKSYMIGGLIKERNETNTVLIVLGAKTETEEQFIKMFCDNDDFKEYGIITDSKRRNKCNERNTIITGKNIIILSQEKLKVNLKNSDSSQKFWKKYNLDRYSTIDIYFDEIHKGGSTENAEKYILNEIIKRFTNENIGLFAMVTATYAKPTIAYSSIIDDKSPIIINWTYEDQQNMKKISDPFYKEKFIDSKNNIIQKQVIEKLFIDFKFLYQDQYLNILEDEYKKHPEMVMYIPHYKGLTSNTFKLKCGAIQQTSNEDAINPVNIFQNKIGIDDLIRFIGNFKEMSDGGKVLDEKCIYGKLTYDLNYDVLNKPHTELWFLPYTDLYDNPHECREELKQKYKSDADKLLKQATELTGEEDSTEKDLGLPNIEPITRGLVSILLENELFNEKYCFLIVHGQIAYINPKKKEKQISTIFETECVYFSGEKNKKSINEFIKECEIQTSQQNKSLIILTGSMLRLGISLPCADIAFNFDHIMSVDLNYQTMFRVLTERKDKKYGYYFDFNPERPQSFLYEFNQRYNSQAKSVKESVDQLQSLLYLFNYNGLGITKQDALKELKTYDELSSLLKLNKKDYGHFFIKNGEKSILAQLSKIPISDELKKRIRDEKLNLSDSQLVKKIDVKVKKGTKQKSLKMRKGDIREESEEDDGDSDDDDDDSDNEEEMRNEDIAKFINDYTSIMALFSNKYNYNCDNIVNCIERVEKLTNAQGDILCLCNNSKPIIDEVYDDEKKINVLGCFMKRVKGYTKEKFLKSLEIYKNIVSDEQELMTKINFIFNTIIEHMGKDEMLISNKKDPSEILTIINKYLPIRKVEKDTYGEVFTPPSLINEMFDKMPKQVWSEPHLKWLDPANGIGNFPMIAYVRLMEGLKKKIPDDKKRSEHIIENMLYMVELNEKNVAVSRKIFGRSANIFCGSFLTEDSKSVNPKVLEAFGIDKFDVIMGNPPFNAEGRVNTGNTLWPKFVEVSIDLLKPNKYLLFVHPAAWRKPESEKSKTKGLFNLMAQKNSIKYLEIHNTKDGIETFNAGTRYDWYVLQKTPNTTLTIVKDEKGIKDSVNLNDFSFLPNFDINAIRKILKSQEEESAPVIYSRNQFGTDKKWTSDNKSTEFKYPLVHSTPKTGTRFYWSSTMEPPVRDLVPMFGVKKVIFGASGLNNVIIDINKINDNKGYGLTDNAIGIKISSKKEGEKLKEALESEKFERILESLSFGNFRIDWRMFTYFKPDFYKILLEEELPSAEGSQAKHKKTKRNKHKRKQTKRKKHKRKQTKRNKYIN